MDSTLTKKELRAYLSRWQKVNARELKELRDSSMTQKIAQLNALILSVNQMGWVKSLGEEDAKVQKRKPLSSTLCHLSSVPCLHHTVLIFFPTSAFRIPNSHFRILSSIIRSCLISPSQFLIFCFFHLPHSHFRIPFPPSQPLTFFHPVPDT